VLHRLGDVYGPVVNIAARLTALARPPPPLPRPPPGGP
jgi:class 3 adenylate cyclase